MFIPQDVFHDLKKTIKLSKLRKHLVFYFVEMLRGKKER